LADFQVTAPVGVVLAKDGYCVHLWLRRPQTRTLERQPSESAMRLTHFSDYALRVLIYAAAHGDRLITIEETANVYGISRNHLMKVANQLTRAGYLKAVRGRSGGLALAKRPNRIKLGDVVRATEPDFALVECFTADNNCLITPRCRLRGALKEALAAFTETLDRYTLADLILSPNRFGVRTAA
jgi:Rrf2 family transcriptional regulator, nitric oxide-sensitive transcriptional repressor